jgi:hypothetical protein
MTADQHIDLTAGLAIRKLSIPDRISLFVRGMLRGYPPGFPIDFSVYTRSGRTDMTTLEGWHKEILINIDGGIIQISSSKSGAKTLRFSVAKEQLVKLYRDFKASNAAALEAAPYRVSSTLHKSEVVSIIAWGKESGVAYGTGINLIGAEKTTLWDVLAEIDEMHGYQIVQGELKGV